MKSRRDHKNIHLSSSSRRMFLKSAGQMTLSIPFLPSLLTAASENAIAADSVAPLRYVNVLTPHGGLQHKNWFGSKFPSTPISLASGRTARVNLIADMIGANGLSPIFDSNFNNLWSKMNLIAGLDQPVYFGHNRVVANGCFANNHDGYRFPSDQLGFNNLIGENPSVDQILGLAGGQGIYTGGIGGRKRFLNIATDGSTSTSWGRDDFTVLDNPVVSKDLVGSTAGVFSSLFGSLSAANQTTGTLTANPLVNLINQFWPSGKTLFSSLSGEDRNVLDKFFQLAQDASKQYSVAPPVCDSSVKPAGTNSGWGTDGSSLQALADIITMAFKCDVTRIVTIYIDGVMPLGDQWHQFAHAPTPDNPNANQDGMVQIHNFIAKNFFARLGNNLLITDPMDGTSSILDNSLIYWSHENKAAHNNYCNPTFLMGGAGGRIKTGQFADVQDLTRPANNNIASNSLDAVGDVQYAGEIINRLWASLFYAFNIPRSQYEMARGGNSTSMALTQGFGHVLPRTASWYPYPDYDLTRIGEPLEFLTKPSIVWG